MLPIKLSPILIRIVGRLITIERAIEKSNKGLILKIKQRTITIYVLGWTHDVIEGEGWNENAGKVHKNIIGAPKMRNDLLNHIKMVIVTYSIA